MKGNIKLGDILIGCGYITKEHLEDAIILQKQNRTKRLGEMLISMKVITEEQLLVALGQKLHHQIIDLNKIEVDLDVVNLVPHHVSVKYSMLPILKHDDVVYIAINDPVDFYAMEYVRSFIQEQSEFVLCKKEELDALIIQSYTNLEIIENGGSIDSESKENSITSMNVKEAQEDNEIEKVVTNMINNAYMEGATDVHVEPFETFIRIRTRMDGELLEYGKLESKLTRPIVTKARRLAKLEGADGLPQEGSFMVNISGEEVRVRVSLYPSIWGEKMVLRFVPQVINVEHGETYGMNEAEYNKLAKLLKKPQGIIYISGPIRSGKTTTLYMMLQDLVNMSSNVSTIEDPVEREIPGVIQAQVDKKAGLTFATGTRALLSQDTDVIVIGETNDPETAKLEINAGMTGHLVLSTLHTNDAISSLEYLAAMGVKQQAISNAVVGIVGQRLVKEICPHCRGYYAPTEEQRKIFPNADYLYAGAGCSECNNKGYEGSIAVHEILEIDDELRSIISSGVSKNQIYEYVKQNGKMRTIDENIHQLVMEGVTTYEEYIKHTIFER